jgi:hypothetical protein
MTSWVCVAKAAAIPLRRADVPYPDFIHLSNL